MATVAETQAYLDEAKSPSLQGPGATRDAVKAFATEAGKWERQVAHFLQFLKDAEIAETDPEIHQLFEEGMQDLKSMRRHLTEAEPHVRGLVQAGKSWKDWDGRLREKCEEKGYTV